LAASGEAKTGGQQDLLEDDLDDRETGINTLGEGSGEEEELCVSMLMRDDPKLTVMHHYISLNILSFS
jgi:hypothetical protein